LLGQPRSSQPLLAVLWAKTCESPARFLRLSPGRARERANQGASVSDCLFRMNEVPSLAILAIDARSHGGAMMLQLWRPPMQPVWPGNTGAKTAAFCLGCSVIIRRW